MEFRLLGPVGVLRDGVALPLPRRKQRALLAALLLRPGETVPVDRLVDQLWGGRAPATAVGSLHNLVSQLRRVLGDGVLVTRPPGYAFAQPKELVDLWEFERLLAAGRPREALALWRGPALADLAGEPFAEAEAPRLEERRLLAWEALFDRDLAAGRGSELVADLERLVAEHPLRERFAAQLMRALYQAGRQADALEAYRRTRATLDELGVEPSRELQELQTAILRQDPSLGGGVPAREASARRRIVTIVAAALADSPDDPEAYVAATRRLRDAVAAAAARHVARALDATAIFGDPQLREDDVIRAARAALELAADGVTRRARDRRGDHLCRGCGRRSGRARVEPGAGSSPRRGARRAVCGRAPRRGGPARAGRAGRRRRAVAGRLARPGRPDGAARPFRRRSSAGSTSSIGSSPRRALRRPPS